MQEVFKKRVVTINDIADIYRDKYAVTDIRSLKADLESLKLIGMPIEVMANRVTIHTMEIQELWEGTLIGDRLGQTESAKSRKKLASKVVGYLRKKKDDIKTLILGSGTTVYETSMEVLAHKKELDIKKVYTNSLLVLNAFISHKPSDIELDMVMGTLDYKTASLRGTKGVKYLSERQVDAVVTSFTGLIDEGLTASQEYELNEKHMNLCPHRRCKWVIIPMEWAKISYGHEDYLVRDKGGEKRPEYVIITDPPRGKLQGRDEERSEILKYWEDKNGVEVLRISGEQQ